MTPSSSTSRAGHYVRQLRGYRAFQPAPLPPDPPVVIEGSIQVLLSKADRALGRLDGSIQTLPNPDLFVAMYVRKVAVLSSQIEGTQSSLHDVLAAEARVLSSDSPDDVDEVFNYIRAVNHGLSQLKELPVCNRLICAIHERFSVGFPELLYTLSMANEPIRHFLAGCVLRAKHNDTCAKAPDGFQFGVPVADVLVLGESDPAFACDQSYPVLVWRIDRQMIVVHLDSMLSFLKAIGNQMSAKIPVQIECSGFRLRARVRSGPLPRSRSLRAHSPSPDLRRIPLPRSAQYRRSS